MDENGPCNDDVSYDEDDFTLKHVSLLYGEFGIASYVTEAYESVSKSFRTESITKYTLTKINTR
jgi:hypothetical protein